MENMLFLFIPALIYHTYKAKAAYFSLKDYTVILKL